MKAREAKEKLTFSARFRRMSIRRKLILLISGVSLLVVLLSMVASFLIELSFFRKRLMEEYQATARMVASNLEAAVAFEDPVDSEEILNVLDQREFVVTAAVYLENGQPLAVYRRNGVSPNIAPPPPDTSDSLSGKALTVKEPVVVDGFTLGHVTLEADLGEMNSFVTARSSIVVGLLAFATGLSILLAARLGGRLSQPIAELARTAQRISVDQDYSTRQPRTTDDETGRLVDAFNQMMAEIQSRENAILEAKEKAESSSKAKDDFLSVISHELRTPLNPIIGYVDMLVKKHANDDDSKQLALVKQYAVHLQGIIDDVLDYSRIERGVFAINADTVDTEYACENIINLLLPQAAAKGVALTCEHHYDTRNPDSKPLIITDRVRLQQILLNLLSNAIKFTETGSVKLSVHVIESDSNSEDRLRVEVRDTGIGISPDDRHKVFEPFSQIDETLTSQHGGLGLGLAITRKIVSAMNGTIDFTSEPVKGSLFWFEIPTQLQERAKDSDSSPSSVQPLSGPDAAPNSGRVLLVDDQLVNRELGETLLTDCGQEVVCAQDGFDAIEKAKKETFSLIIMDIKMPKMDGYETARRLREIEPAGVRTPIIAMTAHVTARGAQDGYESGMDDFLAKPFSTEKLNHILEKWLR